MNKDPQRSPMWCVRQRCKDCVGHENVPEHVGNCMLKECKLWPYRKGTRPRPWPDRHHPKSFSPRKAIKLYCLDCCLGNMAERRGCEATDCPIWRWRCGTPPEFKAKHTGVDNITKWRESQKTASEVTEDEQKGTALEGNNH